MVQRLRKASGTLSQMDGITVTRNGTTFQQKNRCKPGHGRQLETLPVGEGEILPTTENVDVNPISRTPLLIGTFVNSGKVKDAMDELFKSEMTKAKTIFAHGEPLSNIQYCKEFYRVLGLLISKRECAEGKRLKSLPGTKLS